MSSLVVVALAAGALALLISGPASATISWNGQGVAVPDDCTGTGNTEQIHFILTSPAGSSSTLTITTSTGGTQNVAGKQSGNGAIQFFVNAPVGDTIVSASATGNTGNSVLTISSCANITTETTTTTTTTTLAPVVGPEVVTVQPTVTG